MLTRLILVPSHVCHCGSQGVVHNIEQQKGDAKWLMTSLGELLQTTSEQEAQLEQQRLETILARYQTLMPAIEVTTTRSSMVVRCYDFKEDLEKRTEWLKVAEDKLAVRPVVLA